MTPTVCSQFVRFIKHGLQIVVCRRVEVNRKDEAHMYNSQCPLTFLPALGPQRSYTKFFTVFVDFGKREHGRDNTEQIKRDKALILLSMSHKPGWK